MNKANEDIEESKYAQRVFDKGFVQLAEWMGDDYAPIRASEKKPLQDDQLLKSLIEDKFDNSLKMIQVKFHIKAPLFVFQALMKYKFGSLNEMNKDYSKDPPQFWIPYSGRSRFGSDLSYLDIRDRMGIDFAEKYPDIGTWHEEVLITLERAFANAHAEYLNLVEIGVSEELTQLLFPLNIYSEFYWSIDMRSMIDFLSFALDKKTQSEIRDYAKAIVIILRNTHPKIMGVICN